jgi:O-antigen ligase
MDKAFAIAIPRHLPNVRRRMQSRPVAGTADFAGSLIFITPLLLGTYFATGMPALEIGMYGICLVAVLPHVGPFVGSLRRNPANLTLVLLFTALAMSTAAAFARIPSSEATQQAKALAATAVWASIYIVAFSSLRTGRDVNRLTQWISSTCLLVTASVYLSALLHLAGLRFGEVVEFSSGAFRAFGPLGDNVSFLLVLPIMMSLVGSRPIMFGVHLGALLLTGTRGAMLCLVIGVLGYFLIMASARIRPTGKRMRWSVSAVAVGCIVWLSPISSVLMGRLSSDSLSLRPLAIEMGISAVRKNPLLGTGFDGFGNSRPAIALDWIDPMLTRNALSKATNQYVQTASDGGVIALACLLLFVLCTGRNALRVIGWKSATPQLIGLQLGLISVLAGNQGALWLLSSTASGFFIFAVAGLASKASVLAAEQPAHSNHVGSIAAN